MTKLNPGEIPSTIFDRQGEMMCNPMGTRSSKYSVASDLAVRFCRSVALPP